ncbi:MAG: AAA family ATPase [Planctomycetes bacterium]|nr:AAA family ATPase [Planctomycetota bacterium]
MLQTIYIERFKTLVKLKLDLGRVNVFIGANGSGKSNLLEAGPLSPGGIPGRTGGRYVSHDARCRRTDARHPHASALAPAGVPGRARPVTPPTPPSSWGPPW